MSKAILILDMPKSCDECDFIDSQLHYCNIPWFGKDVSNYVSCRHEECPLKALPSPIDISGCKTEITKARAQEHNALLAKLSN